MYNITLSIAKKWVVTNTKTTSVKIQSPPPPLPKVDKLLLY